MVWKQILNENQIYGKRSFLIFISNTQWQQQWLHAPTNISIFFGIIYTISNALVHTASYSEGSKPLLLLLVCCLLIFLQFTHEVKAADGTTLNGIWKNRKKKVTTEGIRISALVQ